MDLFHLAKRFNHPATARFTQCPWRMHRGTCTGHVHSLHPHAMRSGALAKQFNIPENANFGKLLALHGTSKWAPGNVKGPSLGKEWREPASQLEHIHVKYSNITYSFASNLHVSTPCDPVGT